MDAPIQRRARQGVLYDRPVSDVRREWVRAWRPAVPGIAEVFHARFVEHAYPPHTHDAWTVFIVEEGAVRYDLETRHRGAAGARVTLLPPHVVHDGRAAGTSGYRKRVLYVDTDVLGARLTGPAVDAPDIADRSIVRGFRALDEALRDPDASFEAEIRLAIVGERLRERLGERRHDPSDRPHDRIAGELRDLLDDEGFAATTLAEAGRILHVSPGHLVRCFTRTFGIAPHRYLMGRRIDAARRRLLEGEPAAHVASEVGFHDQAHLTRTFRRYVGTTPARYAMSGAA
jgi:AraC-like DNA-binding protein